MLATVLPRGCAGLRGCVCVGLRSFPRSPGPDSRSGPHPAGLRAFGSGGGTDACSRIRLCAGQAVDAEPGHPVPVVPQADRRDSRAEGKRAGRDPRGLGPTGRKALKAVQPMRWPAQPESCCSAAPTPAGARLADSGRSTLGRRRNGCRQLAPAAPRRPWPAGTEAKRPTNATNPAEKKLKIFAASAAESPWFLQSWQGIWAPDPARDRGEGPPPSAIGTAEQEAVGGKNQENAPCSVVAVGNTAAWEPHPSAPCVSAARP